MTAPSNSPDSLPFSFRNSASSLLACPVCFGDLAFHGAPDVAQAPNPAENSKYPAISISGSLRCSACGRAYPILDGIPVLIAD